MPDHSHYSYSTASEIRFINQLGNHHATRKTKAQLLRGYLSGCAKRVKWAGIDKYKVMSHAADMMFKEERR